MIRKSNNHRCLRTKSNPVTNPLNPTLPTTPASRQNTAAEQNPAKPMVETKSAMRRETREDPQKASSSTSQQPSSDKKPEDAEIMPQNPDHGVSPKYPVLYPGLVPGSNPGQYDEHTNRGAGVYAVPVHVAGLPLNYLIPLTYNVPTTRPSNETEAGGENQAQGGQVQ